MNIYKYAMIGNMVIESVFTICVTLAAFHFEKIGIMAWYLLLPLMGYSVKASEKGDAE